MQRAGFLVLLVWLMIMPATAQQISARANLVPVPTLVLDGRGNTIFGLHAQDFMIQDDGVRQVIHLDENPESKPLSLLIAVQCGRRANREFGRINGLSAMLDPVLNQPNSEAAVLFFDSKLNLARDFTNNADVVEGALEGIEAGDNGASVVDAIAYSARLLARRPGDRERVLLLLSETRDHGSHFATLDEVVRLIGENYISVYALPFSPYVSQQFDVLRGTNKDEWSPNVEIIEKLAAIRQAMRKNVPETLAGLTGGEYRTFHTQKTFETDLIDFANNLHSRYALSFEPKSPHPGFHQIQVRLADPSKKADLLYRNSYWVQEEEEDSSKIEP
jgi:VWFA-related protein